MSSISRKSKEKAVVRRKVFTMAVPMIVVHILQTMFTVVDIYWIGRLGAKELAGFSWGENVLMVLSTIIVGISVGCSAIIARSIGAKDYEEAGRTAWHALCIGTVAALFLSVGGYIFIEKVLVAMGAEIDIAHIGAQYLKVIFMGSWLMFMMFLGNALLQGSGDMRTPLYATIVATVANLILDPLLIFGYGPVSSMGIEGAAWATVLSRGLGMILCIRALLNQNNKFRIRRGLLRLNFQIFYRILKIGIPGSVHLTLRSAMSLTMMVIVGRFGYQAVAAYGVGLKLLNVAMMPGFGLGAAASILIGQHLGAGRQTMALQSALLPAFYNAVLMQIVALILMSLAKPIVGLFTADYEVIRMGAEYLKITTLPYFAIGAGFVLGKALNGAGDTSSSVVINMVCLWFVQIPLCLFYSLFWDMGLEGVWWGILVASFLQAGSTIVWFLMQKWKTSTV